MQTKRNHAIFAAAPLIAALWFPIAAHAACGVSHPTGVHAGGGGGGVHVSTSSAPGGGATSSGCSTGASAPALHGLTTAASGRVIEPGAHAAHASAAVRTATTRTSASSTHVHAAKLAHHA
jgi:hypothetical protein